MSESLQAFSGRNPQKREPDFHERSVLWVVEVRSPREKLPNEFRRDRTCNIAAVKI